MQPALDKTITCCRAAQGVFQPCKRTYHADEGFAKNEQDGGNMYEPEPSIPHEAESHPLANPDQWQTADDKQHEQEMSDKNDIGQQVIPPNGFAFRFLQVATVGTAHSQYLPGISYSSFSEEYLEESR